MASHFTSAYNLLLFKSIFSDSLESLFFVFSPIRNVEQKHQTSILEGQNFYFLIFFGKTRLAQKDTMWPIVIGHNRGYGQVLAARLSFAYPLFLNSLAELNLSLNAEKGVSHKTAFGTPSC
jgi:hypothetical protein